MLKRKVSNIDILYRASWLARWRRVQARVVAWWPTQLTCALWAGAGGSSHPAPTRPTTAQAPAPSLSHRYPRQSEVSRDLSQKFTYNILIFGFKVHNIGVFQKLIGICETLGCGMTLWPMSFVFCDRGSMIYWGPGFLAVVWFGSSPHPLHPRQKARPATHRKNEKERQRWERGGRVWGGAKNYVSNKALSSINHLIISASTVNFSLVFIDTDAVILFRQLHWFSIHRQKLLTGFSDSSEEFLAKPLGERIAEQRKFSEDSPIKPIICFRQIFQHTSTFPCRLNRRRIMRRCWAS